MGVKTAVVIPTCDRPELLRRAVLSAHRQDQPPDQIVVVYDSPRRERADLWDFPTVKVIQTDGYQGVAGARSLGVESLSPEIGAVCYLDDDDELLPNHVGILASKIDAGAQFAFSKAVFRYPDGRETEDPEPGNHGPKRYYAPEALLSQNIAPVSSYMHTIGAYREVGGWDSSLLRMEDWDLWGRMFLAFGPPAAADRVTNVVHKGHGDNMTDSSKFCYSLMCSWRDVVAARLDHMRRHGRHSVTADEMLRFHVPAVGVVMPVYNSERYLREAMGSILSQTFRDFEVLAVDNCSTDGSRGILEDIASRDSRVRLFRTPSHANIQAGSNLGFLVSRSEYVAIMHSDDVSLPDRLAIQVAFLREHRSVGMAGTHFLSMNEDLSRVIWDNKTEAADEEIKFALPKRCCFGHSTIMLRRKVIETVGGYDESPECDTVEDYDLWVRVSKRYKMANIPTCCLKYRTHGASVSALFADKQKTNLALLKSRHFGDPR